MPLSGDCQRPGGRLGGRCQRAASAVVGPSLEYCIHQFGALLIWRTARDDWRLAMVYTFVYRRMWTIYGWQDIGQWDWVRVVPAPVVYYRPGYYYVVR